MHDPDERFVRRVLTVVIVFLGVLFVALAALTHAQVVRAGFVEPRLRDSLAAQFPDTLNAPERAYCAMRWRVYAGGEVFSGIDTAYVIDSIADPLVVGEAHQIGVTFVCPAGATQIHTHNPQTCTRMPKGAVLCWPGGLVAHNCQPSRDDLEDLVRSGRPFGVLQCGPKQYRFYYPSDYAVTDGTRVKR